MSDLPSREDLKKATDPWWEGTSLQQTLIDILRGAAASEEEARATAQRLAEKSAGTLFFDRERVQEQFDLVRANRRWRTLQEQPLERFDPRRCIFADGVRCHNCGETHGPLVAEPGGGLRGGQTDEVAVARAGRAGSS